MATATRTKAPANGTVDTPPIVEHKTLAEALLAIQREIPAVEPDAVNPHFKSKFVSLGHLISKVRPVLNRHGVAFTQFPSLTEDNKPTLVTVLIHGASGERMEYPAPLFLAKADPQGQGSAITYMRRYSLAAAFGVVDQEDDDGNAGTAGVQRAAEAEREPQLTKRAAETLFEAAKAAGLDGQKVSMWLTSNGVEHDEITSKASAVNALRLLDPQGAEQFTDYIAGQRS